MGCCCGATGKPGGAARRHGANLLCAGNCVFLLVAVWMWIFTVLFFATGGTLQRIGCFTMELKDTEMTAPLDREIDELIHQGSSSVSFPIVFGKILRKISEIQ